MATLQLLELLIGISNGQVGCSHILSNRLPNLVSRELDLTEEPIGDVDQGFKGPVEEVVHGGTVNDTREHTSPESESITYRREADTQMEVLSTFIKEELEQLVWRVLVSSTFGLTSDLTEESIELVLGEELWDVT